MSQTRGGTYYCFKCDNRIEKNDAEFKDANDNISLRSYCSICMNTYCRDCFTFLKEQMYDKGVVCYGVCSYCSQYRIR